MNKLQSFGLIICLSMVATGGIPEGNTLDAGVKFAVFLAAAMLIFFGSEG